MNNSNSEQIELSFALNGCIKGASYSIEFYLENSEKPDFKTELINKATENIKFSSKFLCNYYFSKIQLFKVTVIRRKKPPNMTSFKVSENNKLNNKLTLSTLVSSKNGIFQCEICDRISEIIIIKVENPNYSPKNLNFTLFDYLKAGITLEGYIGIDFTKGTEHISNSESNQYLQAIAGFRETLFDFIRDFEVYGYGAELIDSNENNKDYFNLNLKNNTALRGYTNIESAYKECLNKIKFNEDNVLSPLIQNIRKVIYSKYKADSYSILFLLINSPPKNNDFQNTIDALIEITYLPLSVVIIGIGNSEFDDIKKLFAHKNKISSKGMEKLRNNSHFITMKDCNFNNDILKNKCLKDIPKQIVQYYSINQTTPNNFKENNLDNIKNSFKVLDTKNSLYEVDDCPPPSLIDIQQSESKINIEDINININDNNNNNINDNNINNINDNNINNINDNNINNINDNNINNINDNNNDNNNYNKNDNNNDNNNIIINQDMSNNISNEGNDNSNYLYVKPGHINYYNINSDNHNYYQKNKEIEKSNIYINSTPGKDEDIKSNNNNDRKNPYQKEENKNYNNNKINQIIINKKDDDIRIANNTPKEPEKKMVNETPKGQNMEKNQHNRINNPYAKKINDDEEDIKEEEKNHNNINNINIINNIKEEEKKYFNQTPRNDEQKYFNQTPGNDHINNNNYKKSNPYKLEEKKFFNQTPNPEENNKVDNEKKYINNQYGNKNQSNPFKKDNKPNPFKKENQSNPFKKDNQPNPFKKENQPNPFKKDNQPNPFKKENQPNPNKKENQHKELSNNSIDFDEFTRNNNKYLGDSNIPHVNDDYSKDKFD